ncbi:hypothetical protein N798_02250 [Knoellia flava TL1]|uniref:Uncharacterized protein n=2 Tax=Knoellia flava TaxID=913969 RepID=A0A8H9FT01_9MICO|nr:hypothetical protein [Knoellia flava]KGN35667.1 hypothetical protein N798_02250 [Knoellia flava TL1]GGB76769.1 hypothetical protein GCM10011314_15480 [Knoellia flava]
MDINGLPAHVLVVHGAVVFAPLAALAATLLAVVPRWRYLTRWPALALALVATVTVWLARISGTDFFDSRFASLPADNPVLAAIREHEERGETLSLVVLGLLAVTAAGAWLLGGPSGFASGRGAKELAAPWLETALPVLLVLVSLATLVYAFLAGDAGARATWEQQG